ncbi:hypothetical protein vseg_008553 [Gypsophila vaccaria]
MEDLCAKSCEKEEEEVDYFEELPDPIVAMILDKVQDARALCRCLAVSKRFASLVSEVGSVCITMNVGKPVGVGDGPKLRGGSKGNIIGRVLRKPLNFIHQIMNNVSGSKKRVNNSSTSTNANFGSGVDVFKWVSEVLRNFGGLETVSLELPCNGGEIGMSKSIPLLKWEASFGEVLEGCVIIGANSVLQGKNRRSGSMFGSCNEGGGDSDEDEDEDDEEEDDDDEVFSDEELRLRIIWIISCLIASSGRHNLMRKMVGQCPKLRNAVISDAGGQGKLHMNGAQIQELRNNHINNEQPPAAAEAGAGSTTTTTQVGYVGNLVMKLWYVKELELPTSGQVMKGATLVVIKPENGKAVDRNRGSMWGGFEGDKVFGEASKELLKRKEKRVYRLEVNSF